MSTLEYGKYSMSTFHVRVPRVLLHLVLLVWFASMMAMIIHVNGLLVLLLLFTNWELFLVLQVL